MKNKKIYLMIILLSLCSVPSVNATEKKLATASDNTKEIPIEVKTMLNRLDEIKAMDKSTLNSTEKKALRKEVRAINTNLKSTGHGVYLSIGAIIIIILLLILLL